MNFRFKSNSDEIETLGVHIDAANNNIKSIWIDPHLTIQSLNLHDNHLTDLRNLTQLSTLLKLNLNRNALRSISTSPFVNLTQLTELSLDECGLTIDNDGAQPFAGLASLKVLKMASNKINQINATWLNHLENLEELDLSDLALTHLPYMNWTLNSLRYLYLAGNNFSCKYLSHMMEHFKDHNVTVLSRSYLHLIFGTHRQNIFGIDCTDEEVPEVVSTTMPTGTHSSVIDEELHKLLDEVNEIFEKNNELLDAQVIIEKIEHEGSQIENDISIIKLLIIIVLILSVSKLLYLVYVNLRGKFVMQRKLTPTYMHFTDIKTTSTSPDDEC